MIEKEKICQASWHSAEYPVLSWFREFYSIIFLTFVRSVETTFLKKKLIKVRKANGEYCFHKLWIYSFCSVRILLHRFCTSKVFQKGTAHTGVAILKLTINLQTIRKQGKIIFTYKDKMLQSSPDSPLQTYQSVMNITLWQNKRDTQLFS